MKLSLHNWRISARSVRNHLRDSGTSVYSSSSPGSWCQRCEKSAPWWQWGYGIGRHELRTTNTTAFYQWHTECTEILCIVVPFIRRHHMIMHSPKLQGSVHNLWIQTMYQFLLGLHCHQACHPLSMFGMLWINMYQQCDPVPANIQQLRKAIEEEWDNIPQATINSLINSMRRRCVAVHDADGGHTRYWPDFWSTPLPFFPPLMWNP